MKRRTLLKFLGLATVAPGAVAGSQARANVPPMFDASFRGKKLKVGSWSPGPAYAEAGPIDRIGGPVVVNADGTHEHVAPVVFHSGAVVTTPPPTKRFLRFIGDPDSGIVFQESDRPDGPWTTIK